MAIRLHGFSFFCVPGLGASGRAGPEASVRPARRWFSHLHDIGMMGKSTFLSQFSMGIGRDNSPETMDFHIKKLRLSCKISQPLPNSEELWKNFRKNKLFFF